MRNIIDANIYNELQRNRQVDTFKLNIHNNSKKQQVTLQ